MAQKAQGPPVRASRRARNGNNESVNVDINAPNALISIP